MGGKRMKKFLLLFLIIILSGCEEKRKFLSIDNDEYLKFRSPLNNNEIITCIPTAQTDIWHGQVSVKCEGYDDMKFYLNDYVKIKSGVR